MSDLPKNEMLVEAEGLIVTVSIQCFTGNFYGMVKAAVNPLVKFRKVCISYRNKISSFKVTKKIAACVPYLVTETASKLK